MKKFYWVLCCDKGNRPFYAINETDWTFKIEEALKFKSVAHAFEYKSKHSSLNMYSFEEHEFDFDFEEEPPKQESFNFEF